MPGLMMNTSLTSKNISGKRVSVGLSGGVDSAVSAALLKEQGAAVTGVFIKAWQPEWMACTWREERRDAMRVCLALDIPFLFFDFEKEYKQEVVDKMLDEYRAGRTPNPDVLCNKEIKFGIFWQKARELGADLIATGHYLSGEKDQSYFLWTLTKDDLAHTLFPVGQMEKSEVRIVAKKYNLPVAEKKDSQGICFIGNVSMEEFLSHYIESKQGKVLNTKGEEIGTHKGLIHYTIGQRHGFEAFGRSPYYVLAKDVSSNALIVSDEESEIIKHSPKRVDLKDLNLRRESKSGLTAQIRYRGEKLFVRLINNKVEFEKPALGLSLGQSIVFYKDNEFIGGAVMDKIIG